MEEGEGLQSVQTNPNITNNEWEYGIQVHTSHLGLASAAVQTGFSSVKMDIFERGYGRAYGAHLVASLSTVGLTWKKKKCRPGGRRETKRVSQYLTIKKISQLIQCHIFAVL